jgi:transglutaminase-like putative cysteine protease
MANETRNQWDWPSISVLFIALMTAAGRLYETQWTDDLLIVYGVAALGLLIGLALGRSIFGRRMVAGLALAYTCVVLPWELAGTVEGLTFTWLERATAIGNRLIFALTQFTNYESLTDPILFLAAMILLYWLTGLLAGYFLVRHASLPWALIPGGILTLTITVYDGFHPSRVWFMGFYLFCALLLIGRIHYLANLAEWQKQRVMVAPESSLDIGIGTLVTAAVILIIAWNLPVTFTPSAAAYDIWRELTRPFNKTLEHLSDALAPLRGTTGVSSDFYANSLPLGLGNPLGDNVVFIVDISAQAYDQPRFYWRGRIYDQFTGEGWTISRTQSDVITPIEDDLIIPDRTRYTPAVFIFTTYIQSQRLLYAPSQPLWINRPVEASFFSTPDGARDLTSMKLSRALDVGDLYQARAGILNPSIAELKEAGSDYPQWVNDRYLQLPADFSPRIRELARSLTADAPTPYDKATAITDYLRANIHYVKRVSLPPPNADIMEWFLFDTKEGFCNYYATAEVLMLRAVGVPARMAAGFAQGEPNKDRTRYYVRQSDAHAWPEVYFPGYGWIEFEPTANQDPISRPVISIAPDLIDQEPRQQDPAVKTTPTPGGPLDQLRDKNGDDLNPQSISWSSYIWVIILLTGAGASLFWFWNTERIQPAGKQTPEMVKSLLQRYHLPVPHWLDAWAAWNALAPTERAFESINQSLRWLAASQPPTATPAERAEVLKRLIPPAAAEIETLLAEHQTGLYSPHPANPERARRASYVLRYFAIQKIARKFFA